MDMTHSLFCNEVLTLSGVSVLKVSYFRYLFNGLRSSIGLHLLLGFGTKKSLLKKARNIWLLQHSHLLLLEAWTVSHFLKFIYLGFYVDFNTVQVIS